MQRWIVRLLIVVVLGLALWAGIRHLARTDPMPVRVAMVERGEVEEAVTNSRAGTVEARRRAKLSPEIGGVVRELPFREGESVKAGQVVLRLDDSLQRARLAVAERDSESAAAQVERPCLEAERAARELERVRGLVADGIVSDDRLDAVESASRASAAACRAARAAEERARAGVDLARAELEKSELRAPFDALIADLATELGEYATPSPPAVPVPPALDLLDPASIHVTAPMDEVDSARITVGRPVRVTVDSHRGESFGGRVVRMAPYVLDREEQNRTVEIEVELDDADFARTLLPGTSADVEVILERRSDALRIPTSALLDGRRVLVLEADGPGEGEPGVGRLRSREVKIGLRNWSHLEVLGGLEEGERVVIAFPVPEIRDGALVVEEGAIAEGAVGEGPGDDGPGDDGLDEDGMGEDQP